jgi:hypothetical protein
MKQSDSFRVNLRIAKSVWGDLSQTAVRHLKKLSDVEGLAVAGRAVNRALRKAYGIGICSVEELGSTRFTNSSPDPCESISESNENGHANDL